MDNERESGFPFVILDDSEKDCCSNCVKIYNEENGVLKQTGIQWYDQVGIGSVAKDIKLVEAVVLVFEGLLNMNEKRISPLEEISLCYDCVYNLSELYCNYRQFMERSVSNSYFRKVFQKCMLWPDNTKTRTIVESILQSEEDRACDEINYNEAPQRVNTDIKSELSKDGLESELQCFDTESSECDSFLLKQEVDNSDYDDHADSDDFIPPSEITDEAVDTDENAEIEKPQLSSEGRNNVIEVQIETVGKRDSGAVQLPNGKWFVPKNARVLLKKYIEGDRKTLDVGKHRELYGQRIILPCGKEVSIPYMQKSKKIRLQCFEKQCSVCQEIFRDRNLYKDHRRKHREKNQKKMTPGCCLKCGKTFINRSKLRAHEIAVHGTEKPFECSTCGKRFPLAERLRTHIKHFHENTIEFRRQRERRRSLSSPRKRTKYVPFKDLHPDKVEKVTCEVCKKVFATVQAKTDHVLVIHKNQKPYGCKFCEKRFVRESQCTAHEKIHLGLREKKTHTCESCGKSYDYSKALKEHIASHHSEGQKPFMCELCGKDFAVEVRLRRHKARVHETWERTHECEECHRKFKTKEILTAHKKLHTEERPFSCTECKQTFKLKKHLQKHTVTQHCIDSVANCDICYRGFVYMADYEEHMKKGYHIQPKWLRQPTRKRNYNAPSYLRARMERKLERQKKRLEREALNYSGELGMVVVPKIVEIQQEIVVEEKQSCESEIAVQEKPSHDSEIVNQKKIRKRRNSTKKRPAIFPEEVEVKHPAIVPEKVEMLIVEHPEQIIYEDMEIVPDQIVRLI